jgi:hypothetical protein
MKVGLLCGLVAGGITIVACGPTSNNNQTASAESAKMQIQEDDDSVEESASLGLAGTGDRICKLSYELVKKDAAGNYSVSASGVQTDNLNRTGFGRGCLNFCVAAFDELMKVNKPNGIEILVKACSFAETATPAVAVFQSTLNSCKVIQADQKVILAVQKNRQECVTECNNRETTNPGRRCEWGTEILRAHPLNQCVIRGGAGKMLFQGSVTRFNCSTECKARTTSNPLRTCLWGGENVKQ